MSIPDYQTLMQPVLALLSDGQERSRPEIGDQLAKRLRLGEDDLRQMVPSGKHSLFADRAKWAIAYLFQAGLLERPRRAYYRISPRGRDVLRQHPGRVDNSVLEQFPEFRAFKARAASGGSEESKAKRDDDERHTPEESLEVAYRRLRSAIEADLLRQAKSAPPAFFERLVVELLVRMGYGGSLADAGRAIGKTGDGGIDGIIKEDRLGLDVIHIQAKRWDKGTVGRPDVQSFAGSLDGVRAKKGIFITTSTFSSDARQYVDRIEKRIVLIDGDQLAALMYDFGVGVAPAAVYEIKRVDSDYFAEE